MVVVLPARNAARTLVGVVSALPPVDRVILVDDASSDTTAQVARSLGIDVEVHAENRGYGGNQKTCYRLALAAGADVVVMLHPDGQHDPALVPDLAAAVLDGADVVLGTRARVGRGEMPAWRWAGNRALTTVENTLVGVALSEWHTGFRAWSRRALEALPLDRNSDDFVFDNEVLVQAAWLGLRFAERDAPARYPPERSSIPPGRATVYALGVLRCAAAFRLAALGFDVPLLRGLERGACGSVGTPP